ncbi:MAG: molybdopterin-dependent oxidoreductase [Parvularculaceae bacterium]
MNLTIDGEVDNPLTLRLEDLKRDFETVTLGHLIGCAGNDRRFMKPDTQGGQWTFGAVSCAEWTGVRLAEILAHARPRAGLARTVARGAAHAAREPLWLAALAA